MTMPFEEENFLPSIVRNSLETTSVGGRFKSPNAPPGSPPLSPSPFCASISAGQIWVWKTMLSLPMK